MAVRRGRIELADFFEARVRQATPSAAENIVIHGIGGDAQLQGRVLADVMNELGNFLREGIPVAFHARFDAGIPRRHGLQLRAQWLDSAASPRRFSAFATAQLLLIILNEAKRQRLEAVEALLKTERAGRWLAHH